MELMESMVKERVFSPAASTQAPWAMRLVTDRLAVSPAPYTSVTLDPATQTDRKSVV